MKLRTRVLLLALATAVAIWASGSADRPEAIIKFGDGTARVRANRLGKAQRVRLPDGREATLTIRSVRVVPADRGEEPPVRGR